MFGFGYSCNYSMPFSSVCVSAVSSRPPAPRLWSSQINIQIKDAVPLHLSAMNSTEEIRVYKNPEDFYMSPKFSKQTTMNCGYEYPEKNPKKEKKWSIGSLFRRKKKEESESSSEEEPKKGFLNRKRTNRKGDGAKQRRKLKTVGGFDHVVLPKTATAYNGYHEDGILSDPSGGFSNYIGKTLHMSPQNVSTSNQMNFFSNSVISVGSMDSTESITKRKSKDLIKARAAARRTALGNESSSDEDSSLRSSSSLRIRSDESLAVRSTQETFTTSHNRRSRAARTERYLKRHSRDGENPHNYLRLSKSDDSRSPSCSPHMLTTSSKSCSNSSHPSNITGLSTIPPSHGGKYRVSNSTSNPSYKPPQSMNEYNNSISKSNSIELGNTLTQQRSISCDADIHQTPLCTDNNIMHVQFPIIRLNQKGYRNLSLIETYQVNSAHRQPPQPPPRDPHRTVMPSYFENVRPNTFYLDCTTTQSKSKSFHVPSNKYSQNKLSSTSFNPSCRSTSEVHIPSDPLIQSTAAVRPASTTPEPKPFRYNMKRDVVGYNYLADKNPRSRKPIVIQSDIKVEPRKDSPTQKALDFWKHIEDKGPKSAPNSPQIFTSQTRVKTQVFLPDVSHNKPPNTLDLPRNTSPFKPVSPTVQEIHQSESRQEEAKRNSSNLEEALDELEAIYNSLRLGDENLLERAEQREKEALLKKAAETRMLEHLSGGGALSDSSFSYERFDQIDSPRRKRIPKNRRLPDTKHDDMYSRKFSKDKFTAADTRSTLMVSPSLSYLRASPIQAAFDSEEEPKKEGKRAKEPNITFDDVLYRNVRHAKTSPKVSECQLPFGIPVGPVAPAANSDYLHAMPQHAATPPYKQNKKIPDVVKDDLAFRNLRKDTNKEPVLPKMIGDAYPREKSLDMLRKRRAVRSLSANIGNILGKELKNCDVENEFRSNTLTDIADAMEIAKKVLQEKSKNYPKARKTFVSDVEVKPVTYVNSDTFRESRRKFLNDLKNGDAPHQQQNVANSALPPNGLTSERKFSSSRTPTMEFTTKESTPIPKSQLLESNKSTKSSLDDLLNALAEEAKVTTERITRELKELEEKRNRQDDTVSSTTTTECFTKDDDTLQGSVINSSELVTVDKPIKTETVEAITVESPPCDSAVITQSYFGSAHQNVASSEPDYDNLLKETADQEEEPFQKCQSPFEEKKAVLVATFQELTKDINNMKVPKLQECKDETNQYEAEEDKNKTESIYDNLDDKIMHERPNDKTNYEGNIHKTFIRSKLSKWSLRPLSCPNEVMSDQQQNKDTRATRIARYKEERRKQLAEQFRHVAESTSSPSSSHLSAQLQCGNTGSTSSSSDGPRATRASRLRAQARLTSNQHNGTANGGTSSSKLEKNLQSPHTENSKTFKLERDKSNKRKSNLNRSLTSEEVALTGDDPKIARRRRRFFPQEVLNQTPKPPKHATTECCASSDTSNNVNNSPLTSQNTASPNLLPFSMPSTTTSSSSLTLSSPSKHTPRRSELSIHMENARRGVLSPPVTANTHKYKPFISTKKTQLNSPSKPRNVSSFSQSDKETGVRAGLRRPVTSFSDNDCSKNIARRMEELTAFTRETLAKVERLAHRTKDLPIKRSSPVKAESKLIYNDRSAATPASILKRKSREEKESVTAAATPPIKEPSSQILPVYHVHGPVSILKRKVGQDDKTEPHSTHTPPVTFSPNVVEPATTNRKQGILKKRRSLDESTVMRHRSCSPDVANKASDSKSILKNQRRSSLEELRRTQSPEVHIHGILKWKTKSEDEDHSLNSPQGILKRRSGASSAGSTSSTPHVSITTAVILAAAGGAEIILEPETQDKEPVKPILKKKSLSEEYSYSESSSEAPKPILKKKSSTDTDEGSEEKPMKPILKLPRNSLEKEILDTGQDSGKYLRYSNSECEEVKPILKSISLRSDSPRPRLSFSGDRKSSHLNHQGNDDNDNKSATTSWQSRRNSRRSYTICTDSNVSSNAIGVRDREDDRDLKKARPLSVLELIRTFEKNGDNKNTGAIPKRSNNWKRGADRYRTQPVTSNELEESRKIIVYCRNTAATGNQLEQLSLRPSRLTSSHDHQSLSVSSRSLDRGTFDLTSSLEDDTRLKSFLSSSFHLSTSQTVGISPESPTCHKTSSDSAFQSLGDGLELEEEEFQEELEDININSEHMSLASQMRCLAEEAKKKRQERDLNVTERRGILKQPHVTAIDTSATNTFSSSLPRRSQSFASSCSTYRRRDSPPPLPLDLSPDADTETNATDSAFRKILKTARLETSQDKDDEGISCNDSGSDSETSLSKFKSGSGIGGGDDDAASTSEGESSGGREIRNIFRNESKLNLNFRKHLEGVLSKSKSHTSFNSSHLHSIPGDGHTIGSVSPPRPLQITYGQSHNNNSKLSPPATINLRRSHTHTAGTMPRTIADLRAKLQENGETGWLKRVPLNNNSCDELKLLKEKNRYNEELSEKSILAARKDQLDAASQQWKNRVEKSDAEKFSVAGKMAEKIEDVAPNTNVVITVNNDKQKKTPQAKRFKGKDGVGDSSSTPSSPEKTLMHFDLTRSKSALSPIATSAVKHRDSTDINGTPIQIKNRRVVSIPKPDDYTFTTFFESVDQSANSSSSQQLSDINANDFDAVQRQSLLILKKNVQIRKRKVATKNPIKALATRNDITDEYTEIITGVAEREKKRLNIEKLAQNSNKALEVLAGLASNEDFKSVALKKGASTQISLQPWKQLMLLQIKGRRHVQTRLVEPVASSINEGDCFILITPTELYNYTGKYSNVIEQSRAADVANHIQKTADMGCKVTKIINVASKDVSKRHLETFWNLLGLKESIASEVSIDAGHPSEDESYETNILHTNMIYTLGNDELVPYDDYWGTLPKIEMLTETNVIVFDFGSEMYVWSGKNAPLDKKRLALNLSKQLWDEGFNYSDCSVNPLNVALTMGKRDNEAVQPLKGDKRPPWALFAKITQHRETILFKEKFLDWPDFSRVIKVRSDNDTDDSERRRSKGSIEIKPCNVNEMIKDKSIHPDLLIGNNVHLGRGDQYFDEETRRLFEYDTLELKAWRILENNHEQLDENSIGQFYDGDSYIYNWKFRQTVKGRELNGKPSKYAQVGREMSIFFCWHGNNSSISEKCTAAFLTVELDKQNAPQVRVTQGAEPAAFLQLFNGTMVIHTGKRDDEMLEDEQRKSRLFIVRGEMENEIYLMEVPLEMASLRSRTSFALVDDERGRVVCWHGCQSSTQKRKVTQKTMEKIISKRPLELFSINPDKKIDVLETDEGSENKEFLSIMKIRRESYHSLLSNNNNNNSKFEKYTSRLFKMSSVTGNFIATEVLCPHRSDHCSPYPFVQSELYSGSQPGLVLFDNYHELWLWQGWWPEKDEENDLNTDQTGSGAVRWQAERRAAMQTVVKYWKAIHHSEDNTEKEMVAYLVWAGLEPLEFRNLFPTWKVREDVRELNLKDGKQENDKAKLQFELALLSRTTYPMEEILQRPLPQGVDPTKLEIYLSDKDFNELLLMSKEEFELLPSWKKTALKKEKGLF